VIPLSLLPRRCPVCGDDTIIGHGQRLRQAHDDLHTSLRVRRGICLPCNKTFTILPDWLAPYGQYSLRCRQQADERIAAGAAIEQAAPHCKNPARLPDPSTLRRWAKRLLSLPDEGLFRIPTILAWDLGAFCRILPIEARSP
jgi:transposase